MDSLLLVRCTLRVCLHEAFYYANNLNKSLIRIEMLNVNTLSNRAPPGAVW